MKTEPDEYRPVKLTKNMLFDMFPTKKLKIEHLLEKPEYKKINEQTVVQILAELDEPQKDK